MTDQIKNRPAAEIRGLSGLKAVIWADKTDLGATRYSTQFSRTYVKDGQYFDTSYFGAAELLQVAQLAANAYDKNVELRSSARQAAVEEVEPGELL